MADPRAVALDKLAGKTAVKCNATCKYWRFARLDRPCECSEVFSVQRDEP